MRIYLPRPHIVQPGSHAWGWLVIAIILTFGLVYLGWQLYSLGDTQLVRENRQAALMVAELEERLDRVSGERDQLRQQVASLELSAQVDREAANRLREELATLKKVDRPRIIAAIAEARAHGDLRENAEYHAAKEQQGFIEGRIQHLEYTISHAQIIDVARLNPGDKVVFGATVTLCDEETGDETRYQIVGDVEADIKQNRIAVSSPISRALIGREVGDEVVVKAPAGERLYEIVDVEYL